MSFYEESSIVITPNAYKAGTLYAVVPTSGAADMDVTRATAATRVDESGLVNYAEAIGSELVTNGDFATNIDYWVQYNSISTWDNGTIKTTATSTVAWIRQNDILSTSNSYKVTFTAKATDISENIFIWNGSSFINTNLSFDTINEYKDFTYYLDFSGSGGQHLIIGQENVTVGDSINFDNVSVKEVIRDNVPRIDYTGGGCPHILAEPQRTNLVQYSEAFNSWNTKENVTVAEDTSETTSPSGNNTASKITINSGSTPRRLFEVISTGSGSDYTFTLYAKKGTTDYIRILCTSVLFDVNFDLTNGTKTVTTGIGSIESVGNDWYRIQGTGTSSLTNEVPQIQLSGSASVSDYLYIWGSQFEQGSYPTSYIPTSGATVTRNQDEFTRDGISSLINSTEGVLFVEMAFSDAGRLAILNSDASDDQVVLGFSGTVFCRIRENGANVVTQFVSSANQLNTYYKIAVKYKSGSSAIWVDGNETVVAGTFTLNDLSKILFISEGSRTYGKVKQLQVYPSALSDAELTSLTTP